MIKKPQPTNNSEVRPNMTIAESIMHSVFEIPLEKTQQRWNEKRDIRALRDEQIENEVNQIIEESVDNSLDKEL